MCHSIVTKKSIIYSFHQWLCFFTDTDTRLEITLKINRQLILQDTLIWNYYLQLSPKES
jgi:hypothetical protein